MSKLDKRIGELLGEMRKANTILEGSGDDGGRKAAAIDGQKQIAADLAAVDEDREKAALKEKRIAKAELQLEQLKDAMAANRKASKAGTIGGSQPAPQGPSRLRPRGGVKPSRFMKAAFEKGYQGGEFLAAIMDSRGIGFDGHLDPSLMVRGKASLSQLTDYVGSPTLAKAGFGAFEVSKGGDIKATLGTTGAAGGYVLPNNLVDSVVKPATQKAVYQQLVTTINGVAVRGVDQPYRTSGAQRATFIDWGQTKTNVNEAYGTYSAYLGTIAIIYDIGKQYARFSAGAAEQDVMDEITRGMVLGENYYIAAGAGTGSGGYTGDPTTGVYTALAASNPTYTTAFTGAANTTQIGSLAEALTVAQRALSTRSRESQAWVVDATTYWTAIGQGTDTAGFWASPTGYPGAFTRTQSGGLAMWGVPIFYDSNLGANTSTKIVMGGEWDALKLYRGLEFRIDTTDVAGTRWDLNLIGFRGEEEIGFHAGTAVAIGAMQLVTSAIA